MTVQVIRKSYDEDFQVTWDFVDKLETGEAIATPTFHDVDASLTVHDSANGGTEVTAYVSGGVTGTKVTASCLAETDLTPFSRKQDGSIAFEIQDLYVIKESIDLDERKDYCAKFTSELAASGETIASYTVTVPAELNLVFDVAGSDGVTFMVEPLSPPAASTGYDVRVVVTTTGAVPQTFTAVCRIPVAVH